MRTNLLITVSTIAMLGSAFALPASADDMNNANVRGKGDAELERLQKVTRRAAGKLVNDRTKRRPMIVPVVLAV